MQVTFVTFLGFLATSALAAPQGPFGGSAPAPENNTTPTPTEDISIPLASILAAPIIDLPPASPTLVQIEGGSNSTLVDARPDLQEHVDTASLNVSSI
jgi:hypothetical protein